MKLSFPGRLLALAALSLSALGAHAESPLTRMLAQGAQHTAGATPVDDAKRLAAQQVSQLLRDPSFVKTLQAQLDTPQQATLREKSASLHTVLDQYQHAQRLDLRAAAVAPQAAVGQQLRQLDQAVVGHKGLGGMSQGLLQARLYQPAGATAKPDLANLLVAFAPAGNKKQWQQIEAYDRQGKVHLLDARHAPSFPVLIAGIDAREDMRAGIKLANLILAQRGMQGKHGAISAAALNAEDGPIKGTSAPGIIVKGMSAMPGMPVKGLSDAGSVDTSRLDQISLKDTQEPWILGAAEIYAIVSGVQPNQAAAQIDIVDMPYLDWKNTVYKPNQIMIFWSEYRYAAANIQFYEHDDNTNYQQLVVALINGVQTILGAFQPQYAVIPAVASAIVQAMPSNWFTNDDDYVDSYYTLEKGKTYTDWPGAGNNATMTLTPYQLQQQ